MIWRFCVAARMEIRELGNVKGEACGTIK